MYTFYFWLTEQSATAVRLEALGLLFTSAMLAWASGLGHRLDAMGRARFFLAFASLVAVINFNEISFLWSDRAFVNGWLAPLLLVYLAVLIGSGVFLGIISHARSRDLRGTGKLTFVTFVPFGIFYMLFQPGAAHRAAQQTPRLKEGTGKIVLFGLLIWFAGKGFGTYVETAEMQPLSGEETLRLQGVWIEKRGVEKYFHDIAEDSVNWLPSEPEPGVLLIEIRASGPQITYKYVVHDPEIVFDESSNQASDVWACALDAYGDALRAGGQVESLYVDLNDVPLFDHVTFAGNCPKA